MTGITDLNQLLAEMEPVLQEQEYVFCTFAEARYGDWAELEPVAAVQEREGLTLVVPLALARQHKIATAGVFKMITLNVHSSLAAVGLTAVVARRLADQGISANVVAGYYHDHIFVAAADGERALQALSS